MFYLSVLGPFRAALIAAASIGLVTGVNASTLSFFGPGAVAGIAHPLPARPLIRARTVNPVNVKAVKASASSYTIVDVGSPIDPSDGTSAPVAFNNSGQILGFDQSSLDGYYTINECDVYSSNAFSGAGSFIDVPVNSGDAGASSSPGCTPAAISGPDEHGGVVFVGKTSSAYKLNSVAFTTYVLRGKATVTQFLANDASTLGGVNVAGEEVGQASYLYSYSTVASATGWQFKPNYAPAMFVKPINATGLAVAQPQCISATRQFCAYDLWTGETCGFGGCTINDAGTIVAEDRENGRLMTFAYGKAGSAKDIAIAASSVPNVMINDADQIALTIYAASTKTYTAYLYSMSTAKSAKIPALPANSCKSYEVISLNNKGRVLGYTATCSRAADAVYWTWDPANGIKNLSAMIPANTYGAIQAVGINDSGQILVALLPAQFGPTDWGILKPPSSLASGFAGAN